ncbi:probable LRR receptor-like serine/threonine-protein kinase At3g47570 [Cryptomeria japonica]|uniref:probable LRR receptor-like serine/threonine-protein kinase At3g47570 n=1 Tax=Cryptomeria japonica TaxID=3369 RepID=UPI0027D9E0F6|nr:probable LRR receptor-like serine/threonine-protein kinase At3g47570 [Cryptomeria japonica]
MEKVQGIDISANQLTGNIPSTIGSCIAIQYLNLSFNKINGSIPESLGKLLNLQDIDLSFNNLLGKIPMSLGKLGALQHLNFSTNKLEGEVPKDGVFKKHGAISLIGNVGLCGPWVKLPVCPTPKPQAQSQRHLKRILIPIGAAVFVTWCVLMGFLWRCYCKRRPLISQLFELGPQRISFPDLLTASDGFNEANLIGVGSSGKVYKGVLKDGAMVAIKVFDLQDEDALKIFDRECEVLRRVRHRNLVRVITSYSDPDCKALIFPLMPNGNLDNLLYPPSEHSSQGQLCSLDFILRLRILMDIAQGMEYLHHHCFVQVIHCDLKPSNVLLGEDMTAYLTDFGISRLYPRNYGDSLTSTGTLKGSIGYIAPEYGTSGVVTTKGDVYSYGIVLLEMLTGKKPTNSMFVEGMILPNWVSRSFPDTIEEVIDSHLLSAAVNSEEGKVLNCLRQLICIGLLCTKDFPEERPSMIDIVRILGNIRDTFLGIASTPTLQSDFSHLLGSTSGPHKSDESQSSSY